MTKKQFWQKVIEVRDAMNEDPFVKLLGIIILFVALVWIG